MKYQSTRGKVNNLSFEEALFSGYCEDEGLFVPSCIPKLDEKTLKNWMNSKLSYPNVVEKIVRLFVSEYEIPNSVLKECISNAYSSSKFDIPEIVGLKACKSETGKCYKVAELFHGPSASFKDYALSLVAQFMQYFLSKKKRNVIVLVGTSGDTGSAAIKAVENLEGIDIIVLYPDGKISPVQELQMNSSSADNVHVFATDGTSDDLDVPIKNCFPDPNNDICSINSINWARIMIQIVHFAYLYLQNGEELDIFVPTGAAGNLSAGVLASLMGIPIKLFVATNENDNVEAFLNKGELRMGGTILPTPANAMDIRYPYNLERIIYFISKSSEITASYMKQCEIGSEVSVRISDEIMNEIRKIVIGCRSVNNSDIFETIRNCWRLNNYMICPHTATAVFYYNSVGRDDKESIIISTASPQKFPEIASQAGISEEQWNGQQLNDLLKSGTQTKPDRSMVKGSDWLKILQSKISHIRESKKTL